MKDGKYKIKKVRFYPKESMQTWKSGAYLSISMNNRQYRDVESLKQIIEWIGEKTTSCDVIVGDYLHRHNQQIIYGYDDKKSIETSFKIGEELIAIFKEVSGLFPLINFRIRQIKEFYNREDFQSRLEKMRMHLKTNIFFSESIEFTITAFLRRQRNTVLSEEKTKELSRAYLLEELVVYEILQEEGFLINIYAGSQLPVLKEIVLGKLLGVSEPLEKIHLVEIKFKKTDDK